MNGPKKLINRSLINQLTIKQQQVTRSSHFPCIVFVYLFSYVDWVFYKPLRKIQKINLILKTIIIPNLIFIIHPFTHCRDPSVSFWNHRHGLGGPRRVGDRCVCIWCKGPSHGLCLFEC